jgi:MOSC domain-containing protein YiiM
MGENITTQGIDLLGLPTGTRLKLGDEALIEITGLRNPCKQLNRIQPGLMAAVLSRDEQGNIIHKAGVMAVVVQGGQVQPGDPISIELPPTPHHPLEPV